MSNEFYNVTGAPVSGSFGASSAIRAEFAAVMAGLDKLPTMATNGGKLVTVAASGTELESRTPNEAGLALLTDLTTAINTEVTNRNAAILVETNARIADVGVEEAARIADIATTVKLTGAQTISGSKTFDYPVTMTSTTFPLTVTHGGTSGNAISNRIYNTDTAFERFYFGDSNTPVGSISISGGNTSYNTTSDHRLKEQVVDMSDPWDTLLALRPVEFVWKSSKLFDSGFIAHEVQAVVPNAVYGTKDAVDDDGLPVYQGLDPKYMIPFLVKAVQDLKQQLDELKRGYV